MIFKTPRYLISFVHAAAMVKYWVVSHTLSGTHSLDRLSADTHQGTPPGSYGLLVRNDWR